MKNNYVLFLILASFALLCIFTFRNYFFKNLVPFPSNLLAAFYQPWASYSWVGYPYGIQHKPIGFDNLRIFYPQRSFTIAELRQFRIPLWNPHSFAGNTHLGTYQSAVFHPLSFLFFILPQIDAWSLIVVFQPFLACIFMYLFLQELTLSKKASYFGAIVFAFSGFMVVWWEESIMSSYSSVFLPLILYGVERMVKKLSVLPFSIIVVGLLFSILSGWFQMTFYVFIISLIWTIYRIRKTKDPQLYIVILLAYITALLISSIHLLPGIEAYMHSARGSTDAKYLFDDYLMPLYHLITFVVPDFFGSPGTYNYFGKGFYYEKMLYVGIPGLILSLYALLYERKKRFASFFRWMFAISLSLGFSLPTSWFFLYYLHLPFLSAIIPSRIFFLSTFAISVLAAYGVEAFLKGFEWKKVLPIFLIISCSFFVMTIFIIRYKFYLPPIDVDRVLVSFKNIILPFILFVAMGVVVWASIRWRALNTKLYYVILSLSLFGSLYLSNKYLYFSDRKLVFPTVPVLSELKKIAGINRYWSIGKGYVDTNFGTQFSLYSPDGYDSFYIRRYGELLHAAANNARFSKEIPRSDAKLSYADKLEDVLKENNRVTLLKLLGVRYIVEKKGEKEEEIIEDLPVVWEDGYFRINEFTKAFPRAFTVNDYEIIRSEKDILQRLFSSDISLKDRIILEEEPLGFTKSETNNSTVEFKKYAPNNIDIQVTTEQPTILFLSDSYFPGWKAFVDGKESHIYRANYSFRSVVVPTGDHIVTFLYEPRSFYYGVVVGGIGILLFFLACFKIRYKVK